MVSSGKLFTICILDHVTYGYHDVTVKDELFPAAPLAVRQDFGRVLAHWEAKNRSAATMMPCICGEGITQGIAKPGR